MSGEQIAAVVAELVVEVVSARFKLVVVVEVVSVSLEEVEGTDISVGPGVAG